MIKTTVINFFVVIGGYFAAQAQQQFSIDIKSPYQQKEGIQGLIKFLGTKYSVSLPDQPQLNQSLLLSVDLKVKSQNHEKNWLTFIDFKAGRYIDLESSHFGLQEAYIKYSLRGDRDQVLLGRKTEFWSEVDQHWKLGIWEPKLTEDALNSVTQGITGVFYKKRSDQLEFLAYSTPLFIPTMGPEIREDRGSLVSDNRWYKTPEKSVTVFEKKIPVYYHLDRSEVPDLVKNPGAGGRLSFRGNQDGSWMSVNYAYKPMNALLVKYDAKAEAILSNGGKILVSPAVGYHRVWGVDLGYKFKNGPSISFSHLSDKPEKKLPQNKLASMDLAQQQASPMEANAFHLDFNIPFPHKTYLDPLTISLDYLKIDGAYFNDFSADNAERGSLNSYRFDFYNAISTRLIMPSYFWGKKVLGQFRWLRDFDQMGNLYQVSLSLFFRNKLMLDFGFDVLGVDDESANNKDPRFLNQFRTNDRLFGAFGYVF